MKKLILSLMLLGLLCGAALLVLWVTVGLPTNAIHLTINEHEMNFADLNGWHAAFAGAGVLFALCIVALVVPLALLLGLLLPLLLVLGALLLVLVVALGAGAIALAPLLLPVAILWWLWRRSQAGPKPL